MGLHLDSTTSRCPFSSLRQSDFRLFGGGGRAFDIGLTILSNVVVLLPSFLSSGMLLLLCTFCFSNVAKMFTHRFHLPQASREVDGRTLTHITACVRAGRRRRRCCCSDLFFFLWPFIISKWRSCLGGNEVAETMLFFWVLPHESVFSSPIHSSGGHPLLPCVAWKGKKGGKTNAIPAMPYLCLLCFV